jgi:sarcosine oxidase subunit delta
MSFLLPCPTCGPRPVDEFSWGGELTTRPAPGCDDRELFRTLYMKRNVAGPQQEWWFHSAGCREWFTAERDTRTNEVLGVARPARRAADSAAPEPAPAANG